MKLANACLPAEHVSFVVALFISATFLSTLAPPCRALRAPSGSSSISSRGSSQAAVVDNDATRPLPFARLPLKVCIIGGGIGGASTAKFLDDLLRNDKKLKEYLRSPAAATASAAAGVGGGDVNAAADAAAVADTDDTAGTAGSDATAEEGRGGGGEGGGDEKLRTRQALEAGASNADPKHGAPGHGDDKDSSSAASKQQQQQHHAAAPDLDAASPLFEIHVFEKQSAAGGRAERVELDGQWYEKGASIIHSKNLHLVRFAQLLQLEQQPAPDGSFGIWDGRQFRFRGWQLGQSGAAKWLSEWLTALSLAVRYSPWGLSAMQVFVQSTLDRWMKIYDSDRFQMPFETPDSFLSALGLEHLPRGTLEQVLAANGVPPLLIQELVTMIMRIQYGQSSAISGLAGAVGLCGSGGELWQVKGGNYQIASGLLNHTQSHVHFNSTVTSIKRFNNPCGTWDEGYFDESGAWVPCGLQEGQNDQPFVYEVTAVTADGSGDQKLKQRAGGSDGVVEEGDKEGSMEGGIEEVHECSAVVVAAPLHLSGISIQPALPADLVPPQPYQHTHVTFVKGILNNTYFGLASGDVPPGTIGTIEDESLPFSSISLLSSSPSSPLSIFKVFSRQQISQPSLSLLFRNISAVKHHDWAAYPHYSPPERFAPFLLDDYHLYYTNAIETAASAMETAAVAAENVARLLVARLKQQAAEAKRNKMAEQEDYIQMVAGAINAEL